MSEVLLILQQPLIEVEIDPVILSDSVVIPLLTQDSVGELVTMIDSAVMSAGDDVVVAKVNDILFEAEEVDSEVEVEPFLELAVEAAAAADQESRPETESPETLDGPIQPESLSVELSVKERLMSLRVDSAPKNSSHRFGTLPKLQGTLPSRKSPRVQPLSLVIITAAANQLSLADSSLSVRLQNVVDKAPTSLGHAQKSIITPRHTKTKLTSPQSSARRSPRSRPGGVSAASLVCRAPDASLRSSSRPPSKPHARYM
jgi:hypothetical protein